MVADLNDTTQGLHICMHLTVCAGSQQASSLLALPLNPSVQMPLKAADWKPWLWAGFSCSNNQ